MNTESKRGIAVIGAGIVGLTTALQLQRAGFSVLLLDAQSPGSGCSRGNAGHFATEQVFPLASSAVLRQLPAMLLDPTGPLRLRASYFLKALPWLLRFVANVRPARQQALQQALSALNAQALPAWQRLLPLAEATDLVQFRGALLVSEQAGLLNLAQTFRQYQDAGIRVNWLEQAALRSREPALGSAVQGAIEFPDVAHTTEPYALCLRLYQQFVALGGEFRQQQVQRIAPFNQGYQLELAPDRALSPAEPGELKLSVAQLVICAGASSHRLCAELGYQVPLEAERGYHLMTQCRPLQSPVSSLERKFIMTPMQHGLRLAGTVEFAGINSKPDYRRASVLLQHANQLLAEPTSANPALEPWAGNRPSLPDSLPVLGPAPRHAGVYLNFGHQHLGLTWAALTAEITSALLQGQPPGLDLSPYRINRF
jgi:D-amino-acid dehydrogenase